MIRKIIMCCLAITELTCCYENIPNLYNFETNQNYSTIRCINNILTKYFPCGTLTAFVNPNINEDQLIKITNGDNICHSIIVRSFDDRNWFIWTNVYVITAEHFQEFYDGMLDLTRDVFWNPRAKFIIQVNNLNDNDEIQEVFKSLMKYRIYDIVLLQTLKEDALIYSYHPFENQNCGKHFDEVITLGTCEEAKHIIDYFPNKIPNDLNNCTIKVVGSDDIPNFISPLSNYTVYGKLVSGLEQYVLDTVAAREGCTIDYNIFDEDETYGIVLPNKSATGLLHYIDRGKADIAAGGYVLMKNRVELFDYLWGFNYASYYIYTPATGHEIWQRIYREFGQTTWLLIGATICFVVLVCEILKRLVYDNTFSILNLWGYFFGNANVGLSTHKQFRMIILCWAWFAYFISNFYNTALVSLVSVHVHDKSQSLDVENLKTLPYKPCISDNTRMFFQYAYNKKLAVGEDIHNCTYTDGSLKYVAQTKKYYAIEMKYSYKVKEYEYINDIGKPVLDYLKISSTNIIVMYLVRGFPFITKFQDYAHRMYEGGLIKNHLQTINLRSYSVVQRHPKPFSKTSLLDLKMHFYILILGYVLSFICCLLEIWYHYIKHEKKLKRSQKLLTPPFSSAGIHNSK